MMELNKKVKVYKLSLNKNKILVSRHLKALWWMGTWHNGIRAYFQHLSLIGPKKIENWHPKRSRKNQFMFFNFNNTNGNDIVFNLWWCKELIKPFLLCTVVAVVGHNNKKENTIDKLILAYKASKMAIIYDALDSPECDAYAMGEDVQSGDKDT